MLSHSGAARRGSCLATCVTYALLPVLGYLLPVLGFLLPVSDYLCSCLTCVLLSPWYSRCARRVCRSPDYTWRTTHLFSSLLLPFPLCPLVLPCPAYLTCPLTHSSSSLSCPLNLPLCTLILLCPICLPTPCAVPSPATCADHLGTQGQAVRAPSVALFLGARRRR